MARCVLATHIPRLPKKKPLRGKKVGFAEKKLRLWLKMAHRVYQGLYIPTYGFLPRPILYEALFECGEVGDVMLFGRLRRKGRGAD